MANLKTEYVPGVCNIGTVERRARLYAGAIGLVATAVFWCLLFVLHASPWWALLIFPAAAGAAVGFLQAALNFCAAFGARGVFNFGPKMGEVTTVMRGEFRQADKAKAIRIAAYSTLIGVATAVIAVLSLFLLGK